MNIPQELKYTNDLYGYVWKGIKPLLALLKYFQMQWAILSLSNYRKRQGSTAITVAGLLLFEVSEAGFDCLCKNIGKSWLVLA